MPQNQHLIEKLSHLKVLMTEKYPISAMALFGSHARGDESNDSDIDILVEIDGSIGAGFIDLANELEFHLGHPIDLVSKKGIKPQYLKVIEKDLIYV